MTRFRKQQILFAFMCLIWGSTWIAMKVGVGAVPPVFFAGTRFLAAGGLLLFYLVLQGRSLRFSREDLVRLPAVTLSMVSVSYALIFWGTMHVSSGVAAVIDLSFLPIALLVIGVALGEERLEGSRVAAVGLGVLGLVVLFWPRIAGGFSGTAMELWGCLAIVLSAIVYSWGSVLARPLLRRYPPALLSAATLLPGGAVMVVAALLFEPGAREALAGDWGQEAWLSWLFLVILGSLVSYTFYLTLVRDWGASRAGTYAFISPAIAVVLGAILLDERVRALDVVAMVIMGAAAWLALRDQTDLPVPQPASRLKPREESAT